MERRQKNDDTLTKLGDIFHYLLVLEHCLTLQDGESIVVEMYGDISKVSETDSRNAEVKHHHNNHNLGERNTDFWKTLKNWIENKVKMKEFKSLILITTSSIGEDSSFKDWNSLSANKKIKVLQDIGEDIKDKEETFRGLYNTIFSNSKKDIKEILDKVIIYSSEMKIEKKYNTLTKHPAFIGVEKNNILPFINELMGYIITKPIFRPHTWIVTNEEFRNLFIEITKRFAGSQRPLPDSFADKEPQNIDAFTEEKFAKEIYKIEFGDAEVRKAIVSHWRTKQTAIKYFHNNPIYLKDFNLYQKEIEDILTIEKRRIKRKCVTSDKKDCIDKSQELYDNSLLLQVIPFGSLNPNRIFFQHGTIHEVVNEREFTWLIKDEEK